MSNKPDWHYPMADYTVLRSGRQVAKRQWQAAATANVEEDKKIEAKLNPFERIMKKMKLAEAEYDEINNRPKSDGSPRKIMKNCMDYARVMATYNEIEMQLDALRRGDDLESEKDEPIVTTRVKIEFDLTD